MSKNFLMIVLTLLSFFLILIFWASYGYFYGKIPGINTIFIGQKEIFFLVQPISRKIDCIIGPIFIILFFPLLKKPEGKITNLIAVVIGIFLSLIYLSNLLNIYFFLLIFLLINTCSSFINKDNRESFLSLIGLLLFTITGLINNIIEGFLIAFSFFLFSYLYFYTIVYFEYIFKHQSKKGH